MKKLHEAIDTFYSFFKKYRKFITEGPYPYLWICLINYAIYLKVLSFGFIYMDDYPLITGNLKFLSDPANLVRAFSHSVFNSADPFYRPLLVLSFIGDTLIGKGSSLMYHATNLMLHVVACCILFVLFKKISGSRVAALCMAVLFAVHPANTAVVSWIACRNDSLLGIFVFLSFILLLDYCRKPTVGLLLFTVITLFFGLLTKETAVFAIPLYALYIYLFVDTRLIQRKYLVLFAAWAGMAAVWLFMRERIVGDTNQLFLKTAIGSFFHRLVPATLQYLGKAFLPVNLSVFPFMKDISLIPGLAVTAGVISLVAIRPVRTKSITVFFGLTWFVFLLSGTYFNTHEFLYEHRMYVPIVGLFIAALKSGVWIKYKQQMAVGSAVLIMVFSIVSFFYCDSYANRFVFARKSVADSPSSIYAQNFLVLALIEKDAYGEAERVLQRSLDIDPYAMTTNIFMGDVLMGKGDIKKARFHYLRACVAGVDNAEAYCGLAGTYYCEKRYRKARCFILEAKKKDPVDEKIDHLYRKLFYGSTSSVAVESR